MATPRAVLALINGLAAYYDKPLTAAQQAAYVEDLAQLDDGELDGLAARVRQTCEFMPHSARILELARGAPPSTLEDEIERAWLAWKNAARAAGAYQNVWMADGALALTIVDVFGGWPEACAAEFTDEMWAAKRKEFGRVYRVHRASGRATVPLRLDGLAARDAALNAGKWTHGLTTPPSPEKLLTPAGVLEAKPAELPAETEHLARPLTPDEAKTLWRHVRDEVERQDADRQRELAGTGPVRSSGTSATTGLNESVSAASQSPDLRAEGAASRQDGQPETESVAEQRGNGRVGSEGFTRATDGPGGGLRLVRVPPSEALQKPVAPDRQAGPR